MRTHLLSVATVLYYKVLPRPYQQSQFVQELNPRCRARDGAKLVDGVNETTQLHRKQMHGSFIN